MPTITTIYSGELRTRATHVKSGVEIITDAPTDNHGKGEAFSPTDLLAASLGSCMISFMGILANQLHINIDGAQLNITKVMAANPRRVSEVIVVVNMPHNNYSKEHKALLEDAAINCAVAKSLHPDLIQKVKLNY